MEQHFRFSRVPFGAEASPLMLRATLQHHDQQPVELHKTDCGDVNGEHVRR